MPLLRRTFPQRRQYVSQPIFFGLYQLCPVDFRAGSTSDRVVTVFHVDIWVLGGVVTYFQDDHSELVHQKVMAELSS